MNKEAKTNTEVVQMDCPLKPAPDGEPCTWLDDRLPVPLTKKLDCMTSLILWNSRRPAGSAPLDFKREINRLLLWEHFGDPSSPKSE